MPTLYDMMAPCTAPGAETTVRWSSNNIGKRMRSYVVKYIQNHDEPAGGWQSGSYRTYIAIANSLGHVFARRFKGGYYGANFKLAPNDAQAMRFVEEAIQANYASYRLGYAQNGYTVPQPYEDSWQYKLFLKRNANKEDTTPWYLALDEGITQQLVERLHDHYASRRKSDEEEAMELINSGRIITLATFNK